MNVNLQQLRAFVTVAKLSSFVQAARFLHISQPALTVQVRQLEETLGVRLLDRNTRTVRCTQIGVDMLPVVDRLLNEIHAVVDGARELSAKKRGLISVAALPSISTTLLPRMIAEFKRRYPSVLVVVKDAVTQKVLSMVKAENVDFGIGSFAEQDSDFQFKPLFEDHMCVVFLSGCPLERKKAITLKDLAGYPLILMSPESSVRALVNRAFQKEGLFPSPAYEVSYMSTAAGMVRAGLGISILPSSAIEMGELSGLRSRHLRNADLTRSIGLIERRGRSLSPAAGAFVESILDFRNPESHPVR